jgi:hypothetical protein
MERIALCGRKAAPKAVLLLPVLLETYNLSILTPSHHVSCQRLVSLGASADFLCLGVIVNFLLSPRESPGGDNGNGANARFQ